MDTNDQTTKRPTKPRRRHGLGAEGIDALLARQDGRCAICGVEQTAKPGGRLAVDHDHRHCPGKQGCPDCVRGLLCVTCNNLLRAARDDQRILRAAIVYLSRDSRAIAQGEDMPVAELLSRMFPKPDPRLLPRAGRRDRFFMMLLDAPAAAATVAEAGWMHDHDPEGYREALRRADQFYGGPGASTPTWPRSCPGSTIQTAGSSSRRSPSSARPSGCPRRASRVRF